MDAVIIDAGTLAFNEEDMTATGLLVPYGVRCRSNLGEFEVGSGVFTLPADTTGAALNIEHKREDVVGGIARAWEQPEGIMGTFRFAQTDEGRAAYADAKNGKRKNLSAEVAKVTIRDGKATGGRLFAAALVERPAFEGATLLAAEDVTEAAPDPYDAPEQSSVSQYVTEYTDEDGTRWRRVEETTNTTTVRKITDPEAAPAEETEEESTMTASAVVEQTAGAVPATLFANTPPAADAATDVDLGSVFASIATVKAGMGDTSDAETLLAALTDIKYNATGGLTTAASGVLQPAWVGKLWQGRRYQRKYIDLATHLYGGIKLGGRKGFTIDSNSELVQEWTGNKTEMPSGGGTTATKASTLHRYGWAADVAREWYDLEGGEEVIEAFLQLVIDSYARVTDQRALTDIIAAAATTSTANDRLVAPDTYPTEYPAAMGMLIDAIEYVADADDEPAFALVNPAAWRELLFTPKDLVPEYVSFSVRAGTGEGTAGQVIVKKAPDSYFDGIDSTEPAVVAGAKGAIEFREQGTTPIQVDALDIARGGVDKAVLGYLETFIVRPESLVLVGTEDAA